MRGMVVVMRVPRGLWTLVKEILRHLLRRPVVGICAAARTREGQWLLVRRTDSGDWALPGGTLEWGETLRNGLRRELLEEAGVEDVELGELLGVYSDPDRDPRFHAVTVLVSATVDPPTRPPENPVEIAEARLFRDDEIPANLSHGMTTMLQKARQGEVFWE